MTSFEMPNALATSFLHLPRGWSSSSATTGLSDARMSAIYVLLCAFPLFWRGRRVQARFMVADPSADSRRTLHTAIRSSKYFRVDGKLGWFAFECHDHLLAGTAPQLED